MPVAMNRKSNDHAIAATEALRLGCSVPKDRPREGTGVSIKIETRTFPQTISPQLSRLGQL